MSEEQKTLYSEAAENLRKIAEAISLGEQAINFRSSENFLIGAAPTSAYAGSQPTPPAGELNEQAEQILQMIEQCHAILRVMVGDAPREGENRSPLPPNAGSVNHLAAKLCLVREGVANLCTGLSHLRDRL